MTQTFRTPEPRGATEAFAKAVAAKFSDAYVRSWLGPRTCRFTDTTVFTIPVGRDTLIRDCEPDLAKYAVTVSVCPDVTRAFHAEAQKA